MAFYTFLKCKMWLGGGSQGFRLCLVGIRVFTLVARVAVCCPSHWFPWHPLVLYTLYSSWGVGVLYDITRLLTTAWLATGSSSGFFNNSRNTISIFFAFSRRYSRKNFHFPDHNNRKVNIFFLDSPLLLNKIYTTRLLHIKYIRFFNKNRV